MNKSTILLILLILSLVAGMILTAYCGKGKSRHGYGALSSCYAGVGQGSFKFQVPGLKRLS
jgi:hypothetical protein